MLGTLWTVYLVIYIILTLPFAGCSLVYIVGMILPGILYALWKMFEAMQDGGEFSVYSKVMGRWFFQAMAMILLPCSIMMNYGPNWIWIACITMLVVPTIIWFWMFHWMNISTMLIDKETYDSCKRAGRDTWTTTSELNWEERQ